MCMCMCVAIAAITITFLPVIMQAGGGTSGGDGEVPSGHRYGGRRANSGGRHGGRTLCPLCMGVGPSDYGGGAF